MMAASNNLKELMALLAFTMVCLTDLSESAVDDFSVCLLRSERVARKHKRFSYVNVCLSGKT